MTLITSGLAELHGARLEEGVISRAKELLAKIVIPKEITSKVIDRYIRKALRSNAWKFLSKESKALLHLARKLVRVVKSPTLKLVLTKIFLEIELHTVKGKALFYGIILSMKKLVSKLQELVENVQALLAIGISYLNNPPTYRIYG